MSVGIKEAKMGLYRAVESGATYMALDAEEWDAYLDLQKKHKTLLKNHKTLKNAHAESDELIQKMSSSIGKANEIIRVGEQQTARIQALEKKNQELSEEVERLRKQNAAMMRIQRERANADRKLRPKKEHSGYVVLFQELIWRQIIPTKKQQYNIFRTIFQTPIHVLYEREDARQIFVEDLKGHLLKDLQINEWCPEIAYSETDKYYNSSDQVVFEREFRQNFKSGYYEVILYHNKEFKF